MNTETQSPHPVGSSAWLAAVESLRDTWADRAGYLETLSKNNDGIFGQMQSQQARVLRECIGELYRTVEAANAELKHGAKNQ